MRRRPSKRGPETGGRDDAKSGIRMKAINRLGDLGVLHHLPLKNHETFLNFLGNMGDFCL